MNRREFTKLLAGLINYANAQLASVGAWVVLDYVKRSDEEQKRLFDQGKSKCDGYNVRSRHQLGKAADLYPMRMEGDRVIMVDPMKEFPEIWRKIRARWEEYGGDQMIPWDPGHLE